MSGGKGGKGGKLSAVLSFGQLYAIFSELDATARLKRKDYGFDFAGLAAHSLMARPLHPADR